MDIKLMSTEISPDTLGDLWNILPYAGLWYTSKCGTITDIPVPQVNETFMVGIPFAGDNTGQNPNLQLITFRANTLTGPVLLTGTQTIFLNNYLNHTVRWEIEPIGSDINIVNIGFYSSNYLSRDLGPNRMIPMISTLGPTFYESTPERRVGIFEFETPHRVF